MSTPHPLLWPGQIHPRVVLTPLGIYLRRAAAAADDVAALARTFLTNSDPDGQPRLDDDLELMPLLALRDRLLDGEEHPLKDRLCWSRLPELFLVDLFVEYAFLQHENPLPRLGTLDVAMVTAAPPDATVVAFFNRVRGAVAAEFPDATDADVWGTLTRLRYTHDYMRHLPVFLPMPEKPKPAGSSFLNSREAELNVAPRSHPLRYHTE